jgi:hypothetical protein
VPLVISVTNLADYPSTYASQSQAASELYLSLTLTFFSLSLAENVLVTGLIIFKILTIYRDIQGLQNRVGYASGLGRDITPIISILIESGVLTLVAQLVQMLSFKFDSTVYSVIGGIVVMIFVRGFSSIIDGFDHIYSIMQGISTTIVLVRVEMGLSYDETSKIITGIRFAASQSGEDDNSLP